MRRPVLLSTLLFGALGAAFGWAFCPQAEDTVILVFCMGCTGFYAGLVGALSARSGAGWPMATPFLTLAGGAANAITLGICFGATPPFLGVLAFAGGLAALPFVAPLLLLAWATNGHRSTRPGTVAGRLSWHRIVRTTAFAALLLFVTASTWWHDLAGRGVGELALAVLATSILLSAFDLDLFARLVRFTAHVSEGKVRRRLPDEPLPERARHVVDHGTDEIEWIDAAPERADAPLGAAPYRQAAGPSLRLVGVGSPSALLHSATWALFGDAALFLSSGALLAFVSG